MPALPRLPAAALSRWPDGTLDEWAPLRAEARTIAKRAGLGRHFGELLDEVRGLVDKGCAETIAGRLGDRRFARALVMVWSGDPARAQRSMTPAVLDALVEAQAASPSRLVAIGLADVFLTHFDRLDGLRSGLFAETREALVRLVEGLPERTRSPDLVEAMRRERDLLLVSDGPRRLAHVLVETGTTASQWLTAHGAGGYDRGRFGFRLRHALYLARIAAADHTDPHGAPVLAELRDRDLLEAPGQDRPMFGHEALMALADKPEGRAPSDAWLEAILEIGGDPRQTGTTRWQRWWAPVPEESRERVVRWMSVEDLRLFLRAVESYGHESGNADIIRMFPQRKTFLWGLYEQGLVRETRLILGPDARHGIERQIGSLRVDSAAFTTPERRQTAVIYIDCGTFHLVEGSHMFRLWIYAGRPVPALAERTKRTFSDGDLIHAIPKAHATAHPGGESAHVAVVHGRQWQAEALAYLVEVLGVPIDFTKVLSSEDYYDLRGRLPVLGRRRRAWA